MKKLTIAIALLVTVISSRAVEYKGDEYVMLKWKMSYHMARAWADRVGAEVVVPRSAAELQWLRSTFKSQERVWTGLEEFNGTWRNPEGHTPEYNYFETNGAVPVFGNGVTFNNPGRRGFSKGEYRQARLDESHWVILVFRKSEDVGMG